MLAQEFLRPPDLCSELLHHQQGQGNSSGDFGCLFQGQHVGSAEHRERKRGEDQQESAVQSLRGPQGEAIQTEPMLGFLEK